MSVDEWISCICTNISLFYSVQFNLHWEGRSLAKRCFKRLLLLYMSEHLCTNMVLWTGIVPEHRARSKPSEIIDIVQNNKRKSCFYVNMNELGNIKYMKHIRKTNTYIWNWRKMNSNRNLELGKTGRNCWVSYAN